MWEPKKGGNGKKKVITGKGNNGGYLHEIISIRDNNNLAVDKRWQYVLGGSDYELRTKE